MKYVSLDLETTGLDKECAVIEVAVVLEDTDNPSVPVEDLPHRSWLVRPAQMFFANWIAMEMNHELLKEAHEKGVDAARVWSDLESTLHGWGFDTQNRGNLAGKNVAGFDRKFLPPEIDRYFHHRCIDPGSVMIDWSRARVPGMHDLLGEGNVSHRALDDARDVVRILRRAYA